MSISIAEAKNWAASTLKLDITGCFSRLPKSIVVGDPGSGFYRADDTRGVELLRTLSEHGIGRIKPSSWGTELMLSEDDIRTIAPAPEITNIREAVATVKRTLANIKRLSINDNGEIIVRIVGGPQKLFCGSERFSDAVWKLYRDNIIDFAIEYQRPEPLNPTGYHTYRFDEVALRALDMDPVKLKEDIEKK